MLGEKLVSICNQNCLVPFQKKPLAEMISVVTKAGLLATLSATAHSALAQDVIEEVIVTAQKRSESMQQVPISITALSGDDLDDLNIDNFQDYVAQMPSVSFASRRPGQASLFMRGISEGGNGNQSLQGPSVAIYLNEQPVTAIGFNLDPHVYDIDRIEVLKGPQGTLYGAASQAGNMRIITNQPDREKFSAGFDVSAEKISDGGNGHMAEGFVNIPLSDRAALRLVGYTDSDGGYIDAVSDTITYPLSGITRDNAGFVQDDFNETNKSGMRAALGVDLNDSWTATATAMYQETEADGIWDHDPVNLGELEVSRFFDDKIEDEWSQFSLTVEGDLGFADLTYAGSYLDREFDSYSDYSHYSIDGAVEEFYTCSVYFGPCVDPSIQYSNNTEMTYQTHELRLSSQAEKYDWIVGTFYSSQETAFDSRWSVPTINPGAAVVDDLYYRTNQVREDTEFSVFGEFTYAFTDKLEGTVGYRWFDGETTLNGFVGTVFWPKSGFAFTDSQPPNNVSSRFSGKDDISKLNLSYQLNDDVMVFGTFAEGYRPGGANRAPGVGDTYQPDFVESYELGVKSTFIDQRLRVNASIYSMEWEDVQIGFYNPDISLLGLVDNVGSAESKGMEIEATLLATSQLELSFAYAFNEAELTEDYIRNPSNGNVDAIDGQDLPFTPDNKYSLTAKYDFDLADRGATFNMNYAFTDDMYNDIFLSKREKMNSYGLLSTNLRIELSDNSYARLFIENLTNEVAELYINSADKRRLVTVNQPRTIGVSYGRRFD